MANPLVGPPPHTFSLHLTLSAPRESREVKLWLSVKLPPPTGEMKRSYPSGAEKKRTCGYPVNFALAKPHFVLFILFDIIYLHYLIVLSMLRQCSFSFDVASYIVYSFTQILLFYI